MGLWERIQKRMTALGIKTQKELEAAVAKAGGSLPQSQISGIKNGSVHRPRSIIELAAALHTTTEWLAAKENSSEAPPAQQSFHDGESTSRQGEGRIVTAITPLVEYLAVDGPERAGEILIYKQRIGQQSRPADLEDSRLAFAVKMRFADMAPAFEVGDVLLIQPEAPTIWGKDYLFVKNAGKNPLAGLPRRLLRQAGDNWIVRCFGPEPKEAKLPLEQWTPWFIYGKYSR